ncbi:hypothetical protein H6F96_06540 [Microcoleus sp. FACHB-53]|nr:hypothetical protein [Microcoleus sp. FACHB-53]MBD2128969.1 hypothetical protein [Microcoleus sp. FACHB-1]
MARLERIGNNRANAGGFVQTASQLERRKKNQKGQTEVLSEHLLEKRLEVWSLQHILFPKVWTYTLGWVFKSLKRKCFNIISVSQTDLEEQHLVSRPKIAQTITTIVVKIERRVAEYFENAHADVVVAGELH